jgi:putative heme-binding domain-containing protein
MSTLTRWKLSSVVAMLACAALAAGASATRSAAAAADEQTPPAQVNRDEIFAYHTKDEKGGDAAAGRPAYEKLCAACHRFGGIGTDVGPDLTTITSRFKKRDILEAILWPSKVISDQYQAEMFELSDGKVVSGLIVRETATAVLVRTADAPEKPVPVVKAQIANRAPSTVSLMPEGLIEGLSPTAIADLLAFMMAPPPDK